MGRFNCRDLRIPLLLIACCGFASTAERVSAVEAPKVDRLFPAGGQAGTEVDVTVSGALRDASVQSWSARGQLQCAVAEDLKSVKITIPEDARRGVHLLRFFNEAGVSAAKPFVVGQIPEQTEQEPNNLPQEANPLESAAVTINGVLQKPGDVDIYSIQVPAGRTLVASMQANRVLGSPMDGVLQVLDAQGTVIAQNDDDHQLDPQVTWEAPADGLYYVRTFAFPAAPNSTIKLAGAASYIYRLTITRDAFIDHVIPAVVDRRADSAVRLCGWNLETGQETAGVAGFDEDSVAVGTPGALTHAISGVMHSSHVESDVSRAISVDSSVTGRIAAPGERDQYVLPGVKGQKLRFRVAARQYHSLLDPVLTITAADGKVLSEADDRSRTDPDGETTVTVPADGPLTVTVTDRYGDGGFRYIYVLTCDVPQPELNATVGADQYLLNKDEPVDVSVTLARKNGFAQKVTVRLEGLPEGVTAEPAVSEPKGDSSKAVTLKLTRGESAAAFSGVVHVVWSAEGSDELSTATTTAAGADLSSTNLWLTVIPKPKPEPEEEKPEAETQPEPEAEPPAE